MINLDHIHVISKVDMVFICLDGYENMLIFQNENQRDQAFSEISHALYNKFGNVNLENKNIP